MLTRLDLRGLGLNIAGHLPAPQDPGSSVAEAVREIIAEVRARGDQALLELTERFDHVSLERLTVSKEEISQAMARVPQELQVALKTAYEQIHKYHADEATPPNPHRTQGVTVSHRDIAVERAGCYAPGGLARYPSSVLMCVAPARVAGVQEIILCVPPTPEGVIDDVTLAAAHVAGVDEVYAVGGAQAIAAMALGTESIAAVDVIVGPGNSYVAEAKRQLSGVVGVASAFAGPSEIVVIADETTPATYAAIDLMVQAEHGPDGLAWLITTSEAVADAVDDELSRLVGISPRRALLESTLSSQGVVCLVDSREAAMAVSNVVAPEHLELLVDEYHDLLGYLRAAGAVFCGIDAPASLGDYAAGPNHILPTNRSARFSSALRADDFRRHIHVVEVSREGFERLAPTVIALAEAEGLSAHVDSVRLRA